MMMTEYKDDRELQMHRDFTELITHLTTVAQGLLNEFGEMYPTAGAINDLGSFELLSSLGDQEHPASQEVYEHLKMAMTDGLSNRRFRAVALCTNVVALDESGEGTVNAIGMELIHSSDETMWFFIPYTTRAGKVVEFGKPFFRK